MNHTVARRVDVLCIQVAYDEVMLRALVNTTKNFRV
jgi:hypothetical protein